MPVNPERQDLLRALPAVDRLLMALEGIGPRSVLISAIRDIVEESRERILSGAPVTAAELAFEAVRDRVFDALQRRLRPRLRPVINAAGVVVHTNLGRSLLPQEVMDHIASVSTSYANLEYDLDRGRRGERYAAVEPLLTELTGAEAALVVNNNAAAVLLCLDTLAHGREVIVSRGELVEIGGSFRVPDVMAKSGAILVEVGTTNRTHPADYENAITEATALLLKVHASNFAVVGFTASVPVRDLAAIAARHGLPVMEDLGSGSLVDFSAWGLKREPTVQEAVAAGADVVTFSGDKLLGGPQAGIIVGKKAVIDRVKKNPLTRALRVDKMTLAGLEATLRLYRDPRVAVETIPTLRMLTLAPAVIERRAQRLADAVSEAGGAHLSACLVDGDSRVGGGALPSEALPSRCVAVEVDGMGPDALAAALRTTDPPVIGRIENDRFLLDPRCVADEEIPLVAAAMAVVLAGSGSGNRGRTSS